MAQGFFFYQQPNASSPVGFEGNWELIEDLEKCNDGFVISTFDKQKVYSMTNAVEVIVGKIENLKLDLADDISIIGQVDYEKLIANGIEFCNNVNDGKVVLSRIKRQNLTKPIDLSKFFLTLCDNYKHAFNYLCHIPGEGTWIGASPEKLLVGTVPNFEIASLAGSRSVENRFEWSPKEINEQAVVTTSIEESLKELSIKYNKTDTTTIQAGNVEHLFTGFTTVDCQIPLTLANKLHPTPAVSGYPKKDALTFIEQMEGYNREFYAGVVGKIVKGRYDLYVNLRCAKVYADCIDLYIGGGVTSDSNPSNEWNETEFKSKTLLSIVEKL